MSTETGIGRNRGQYLLTHFVPKSEGQLRWEQGIRAAVSPLLLGGEHRPLPIKNSFDYRWEDVIQRVRWRTENASRAYQEWGSYPILRDIAYFLALPPTKSEIVEAQRVAVVRDRFQALPLYRLERSFGVGEHVVSVSSVHPRMEERIVNALISVSIGERSEAAPDLLPNFGIGDCELHFSSSVWKGRNRIISVDPDIWDDSPGYFAKRGGYILSDRGVEFPSYVRHQVDAVVEIVSQQVA